MKLSPKQRIGLIALIIGVGVAGALAFLPFYSLVVGPSDSLDQSASTRASKWQWNSYFSNFSSKKPPARPDRSQTSTSSVSAPTRSSTSSTTFMNPTQPRATPTTLPSNLKFKTTMTTYFYVGEPSDASNDYIPNDVSYWDTSWQKHYGGVDSPNNRCGHKPCAFTPKENPFYFALAYAEYDEAGKLKSSRTRIPWYGKDSKPLLKNRWIVASHGSNTCYGQWEDVGPNGEDDFAFVFGDASKPINTFGEKAGLDVSPAFMKCLGMSTNANVSWAFIDEADVPAGPWKEVVTTSGVSW